MALDVDDDCDFSSTATAVIVPFVCTVIVVTIIIAMFLSCFRKKKGDKKKKESKKNAPLSPPPAQAADATVDSKPSVAVENHSKDDDAVDNAKRLEPKNFQDSGEALGDFSAVRETEILRSYRKPPPPQNRARQCRAPRALKSSAENLDIFSEQSNDLFEFNEDATIKPSVNASVESAKEKDKDEIVGGAKEAGDDERVKKRGSSQGRSSMLEDINNTLASIHMNASSDSADMTRSMEESVEEVKEEITTNVATTVDAQVEEGVKTVTEEVTTVKEELKDSDDLKPVVEELKSQQLKKTDVAASVSSAVVDVVNNDKEDTEGEIEKQENEVEEKASGWKDVLVEKSTDVVNEIKSHLQNGSENVKEEAGQIDIEEIKCEVKETVQSEIKETVENKIKESLGGFVSENSTESKENDLTLSNQLNEEIVNEKSPDAIESPKKEVKIPPKVSPKPSPKVKPKNLFQNNLELSASQNITEPSPLASIEARVNGEEKTVEKVESPPQTPTSPTSPTSKGASRIPMSKKTSGIPKLALSSSKSSSASPLSSPDSTAKRIDQAEEIVNTVQKEVAEAGNDLKANDDTPTTPNFDQAESEMNRSTKESSPFNEGNRDSKSKLTKLRYSGRKKSSESKSDESGSDRGSRAGSEAKSDDGKKAADETEVEKKCRIPVRGGSKPRSSPPKTLGN